MSDIIDGLPKQPKKARCPNCKKDLALVTNDIMTFNNGVIAAIFGCGECGQFLNISFAGMQQPQILKANTFTDIKKA